MRKTLTAIFTLMILSLPVAFSAAPGVAGDAAVRAAQSVPEVRAALRAAQEAGFLPWHSSIAVAPCVAENPVTDGVYLVTFYKAVNLNNPHKGQDRYVSYEIARVTVDCELNILDVMIVK